MSTVHLIGFSPRQWWAELCGELLRYFNGMDETQWMIISACAVLFGFLCLRGTNLKGA